MARLQIPPLEASDGTLAIVYRIASHAYGEWNVTWPQDYDAPELQPGREQGYVSRLPGGEPPPFGRRFVRQDVSIDAVNGESNVERTLDEASDSLSGEVVVEREIGPEGLGNLKLAVDFKKGDLVPVAIATKVLELPVTRATYRDEVGQLTEPTIGVGYSLLVDRSGLAAHNEESERRIAADLRDLAPRLNAVDKKATQAKSDASAAKSDASAAKSTADQAKQATADNRTYIDEQLDAAGAAVEQGREYLRQMEEHVAAGNAAAGRAEDLAGQAAQAAAEAVSILDGLNPLRDDVAAAHAEVARLHEESSQFTEQAAEHVRLASQHAADAKGYAQQALAHEAEGRRQANAALDAAGAAHDSAAQAQRILDDADGILSQVEGHSQEAKNALSDAESLLANAGGQGKSLGDVLLEVAQKHQETLTAHDDILDLHSEVLEKHSEAIRYVAIAAAQASSAAMYAAQAAQEALNVAADAALAAASAADAADEAAKAADNNRQAIGKLQEADGKLQEADQKLQEQVRILEDSQELLANAVKILAGAVAQAAAAAQYAIQSADNAGKAAGEALSAAQANTSAIAAMQEAEKIRAAAVLEIKQRLEADLSNRPERIIASAAGSSHPDFPVTKRTDGSWYITLRGVKNSVLMSRVWTVLNEQQSEGARYQRTPTTDSYTWSVGAGYWGSVEWARVPGVVKSVDQDITKSYSLGRSSTWYALDDVHSVKVGPNGTDNLDMNVQVGWPDSWGWYRLQIRAGSKVLADVRKEGASTIFHKSTIYTRANVESAKIPPNTTVRAYVRRWDQASSDNHRYFRVITRASWTERNPK